MEIGLHFSIRTSMFESKMLKRVLRLIGNNKARGKLQNVCFTLCADHKASIAEYVALMGRISTTFWSGKVKGRSHFEDLSIERRINSKINNLEECRLDSADTGYRPVMSSSK
jgi:hypothetical protein